jgi:hypothetical protein
MADHIGWRSFWWLNVGLLGAGVIMTVVMFPETRYHRPHPDEILHNTAPPKTSSSPSEKTHENASSSSAIEDVEKIQQVPTATSAAPNAIDLTLTETAARDPYLGRGTPGKWQWALFQKNAHPFKSILLDLWIPWKLFAFPIVEFASFVVSWSCSSFLTINLTQSQAFAAPPYNFSAQSIGV